ncbi:MAG: DUF4397 domain-containing protein [Deltaproteobacteria bacterium]
MTTRIIAPLALSLLFACSSSNVTDAPPDARRTSLVALTHLAPNIAPVDVFLVGDDAPVARGLAYGAPSAVVPVPPGRISFDVVQSGQRLRTIDMNVETARAYTAVVLGDRNVVLEDASTNGTGLRLVHAAPSVGDIDVWDLDAGSMIVERLAFGTASPATEIPVRSRRFGIDVDADAVADLVYDLAELPTGQLVDLYAVEEEGTVVLRSYLSSGSQTMMPEPEPVANGEIRVLHLSPDAPNVDVFANGALGVENLEFTRGTAFIELPPDDYTFDVTATGQTDAVISAELALASDTAFTAVAFDSVANLQLLVLPEDRSPVTNGARIRVVHAAVGVGEVDVLNADDNSILLDDVGFGAATAQFEAPAGVHAFGLDLDDDANPELIFDLPELPNGASANIFAVTDEVGAFLLVQLSDGTTIPVRPRHVEPTAVANARAIHLSPDAPAVNVYANGDAVTTLEFQEGTGYVELPAGDNDIAVSTGALADAFLGPLTLDLAEDDNYTVAVFGAAAMPDALVLTDDLSEPAAGNIRIRAIHTAVGVGEVNIITGGAPLYEDVPFGAAGDALEVPAGAYIIGLDVNDDHHPDVSFALPNLAAGTIANVFATSDGHGTVFLLAQLADGTIVRVDAQH